MKYVQEKPVYRSYTQYIKNRFGGRLQKVCIDAGFTCPNRDGSKGRGGCTYCNNDSFSPAKNKKKGRIREQVISGIDSSRVRYRQKIQGHIVYFQSYSNTYAPLEELKEMYQEALSVEGVVGLSIGTRADCLDPEKIEYLHELGKQYYITLELGLESLSNETLERINRQETVEEFQEILKLCEGKSFEVGAHLILGFPWEPKDSWRAWAQQIGHWPLHFLKLHHLHIVKNTVLGNQYLKNPFPLLSKNEYMDVVIEFLEHLRSDIIIQRVFGFAPKELELSERWPDTTSDLIEQLMERMVECETFQGRLYENKK